MKLLNATFLILVFLLFVNFQTPVKYRVAEKVWPREIKANNYLVTLYQPQIESFNNNVLEGRLALSIKDSANTITFGALWLKVRVSTDLETRTISLENIEINRIIFPDIEDDIKIEKLKAIIIKEVKPLVMEMSLDRVLSSLEIVSEKNILNEELQNDPPQIKIRQEPTVLVSIDGEPKLEKYGESGLEYVINTPFFIAKYNNKYYLKGGSFWYKSNTILSNWTVTVSVPNDVENFAKKRIDSEEVEAINGSQEKPAKLIITTIPTELIVTQGSPTYEPIPSTLLLYVNNTNSSILLDINSQMHYLLLNGRWYNSTTLSSENWTFVEPKKLPKDFSAIPDSLAISTVRSSVPGTPEAKNAILEQSIPQTAVVDRKTATLEVEYDGEPKFEQIEKTKIMYAINTNKTIINIDNIYYCIDNAIWFKSSNAKGPWEVSDKRPEEVDNIPPSSPINNIKYVYIYESTPTVVYVGYTPGYYYSYPYGGVIVYGTGYHYKPWYGTYYYHRPITYGYSAHYNPYTGWGFSVGMNYGWMTISAHNTHYWGPSGYRHGYRHGYNRGVKQGYIAGYKHGKRSNNIYRNRVNGIKKTNNHSKTTGRGISKSTKPNNMYADLQGNVHQRDKSGKWEQQSNRSSREQRNNIAKKSSHTTPSKSNFTPPKASMEQDYNKRSTGNRNYQNYQKRPPSNRANLRAVRPSGTRRNR